MIGRPACRHCAIGAGLIWHLVRHPPITTILIGLGMYGLMRTEPNKPDVVTPVLSRARELAASTTNKVTELVDDAREVVDHTSEVARSANQFTMLTAVHRLRGA
jgi:hypothetical protein